MNLDVLSIVDGVSTLWWTVFTVAVFTLIRVVERWHDSVITRHAVITTGAVVGIWLWATSTDVGSYRHHTRGLVWMLGPATTALGIPLVAALRGAGRRVQVMVLPVMAGGVAASATAVGIGAALGGPDALDVPLSAKSITTPIALAVTEPEGAAAGIVAGLVVLTGAIGAVVVPHVLRRLRVDGPTATGLAMGTVAHAVGTASLARRAPAAVGASSLALAVNGAATSVWLPVVLALALG